MIENKIEQKNENITNSTINNYATQVIGKSYEYNELLDQIKTQQKLFDRTPGNEEQERLEISAKINELNNRIEQFKEDVLRLAEQFNRIEINTERLRRAKEHFDKGELGEARTVLESELEQMNDEYRRLISERDHYEKDVLPKLINNSEEFLLLALSTRTNYDNPNWLEDTCQYFERSIEAFPNKANVFQYAYFLDAHNKFDEAEKYYQRNLTDFDLSIDERALTLNNLANLHRSQHKYEEALIELEENLESFRKLTKVNPSTYLYYLAGTLNNLAVLHKVQNKYEESLKEYEEALEIYRELAKVNPSIYLPYVATTLNNLANLHSNQNKYEESLKEYEEALEIRRELAKTNPSTYLPDVAMTLNNLANLDQVQNRYEEALKEYEKALEIYRELAKVNPSTYLPYVAMTLNNFAGLHFNKKEFNLVLEKAEESTKIYKELSITNFQTYFPYLAGNYSNLSTFYQKSIPQKEKSIEYAMRSIKILLPYLEKVPFAQQYINNAIAILVGWGLNGEQIEKLIREDEK
ncbi:MAG: tetratricopeptide repeat protein [Pyrinomonadaceae bacterium]|nr:tetratricopeptide repeat protein [Pyrinomonadaceae bacterium]